MTQNTRQGYCISDEPTQTISLNGGDEKEVIFQNLKKPELAISKIDADSGQPVPGTVFTVKAINGDYQDDWTTGADGKVSLRVAPGTYQITEKSVPAPYYLPDQDKDRVQTISLNPGAYHLQRGQRGGRTYRGCKIPCHIYQQRRIR